MIIKFFKNIFNKIYNYFSKNKNIVPNNIPETETDNFFYQRFIRRK